LALESLHTRKPREKSGSRTSSRFEFQANFSILKLLDLHESGNDYRALFDHFDDLTILNSSDTPTRIKFYQIKGRDSGKHWTIKQLVKEDKAATSPKSVIGKMYKNASSFSQDTECTAFASNASYDFLLEDGTKTTPDNVTITGAQLHATELQAIERQSNSIVPQGLDQRTAASAEHEDISGERIAAKAFLHQ
jgi:Cap4 dsDNA endonuclease